MPTNCVSHVKSINRDLEKRAEDDADERHESHRDLRGIVLDALVGVVYQGAVLCHVVVGLLWREVAFLQMQS